MKLTVLELVRRHGVPKKEEEDETAYESEESSPPESQCNTRAGKN